MGVAAGVQLGQLGEDRVADQRSLGRGEASLQHEVRKRRRALLEAHRSLRRRHPDQFTTVYSG
jgi:hypothetical protein